MRYIRCIFSVLLLLFLLTNGGLEVFAINIGFSTEPLPEDDIDTFLENVNISMLADEPEKKAIACFDVNENGEIVIGSRDSDNKTVCVYTSDGDFQYGYSFECSGSFGIELDKNILYIYFVRNDVAIAVNPMGEVESIRKIQDTSENNSYWNNSVLLTRRKVGDNEYILTNNMSVLNVFASTYSQLVTINKNGEESVIYDVGSTQFPNMVAIFIGAIVFIGLAVFVVIWQFIKLNRST
ncbi:MAG: hypothetical protein PUJ55_01975 [Clostridiales bacterium]|nr:hypothetical protein [Clostridiales bacterium]MDY4112065.1 hypothetical protein [Roseburia sp.]